MSKEKWDFDSLPDYIEKYREATEAEHELEEEKIENFNSAQQLFSNLDHLSASYSSEHNELIIRIDPKALRSLTGQRVDWDLPQVGEQCKIALVKKSDVYFPSSDYSLIWFAATRTPDLVPLNGDWQEYIEFQLSTRNWQHLQEEVQAFLEKWMKPLLRPDEAGSPEDAGHPGDGDHVREPSIPDISPNPADGVEVMVEMKVSMTTYLAEIGALRELQRFPDSSRGQAFRYMALLKEASEHVNLFDAFPHMRDLEQIPDPTVRQALQGELQRLDEDQIEAFRGLESYSREDLFPSWGTGAGKTTWSLFVAAMAQAASQDVKVLYLMDINKPLDDAATQMHQYYKRLGMKKVAIRMYKWPLEQARGEEKRSLMEAVMAHQANPNFGSSFFQHARRWKSLALYQKERETARAPTLDEAVWLYYKEHQDHFRNIEKTLEEGEQDVEKDDLNEEIESLYEKVLRNADFIACTSVAARCHFDGMFAPDLVIFDEAAHARELSTLIPVAFFRPKAWIFVGDPRQRSPYTTMPTVIPPGKKSESTQETLERLEKMTQARQLRISMLERAVMKPAISHELMINRRAYGGLEMLPSVMFYNGKMRSNLSPEASFPESVKHLRHFLTRIRGEQSEELVTPRLLVDLGNDAMEEPTGSSFHNEMHQDFVMARVKELLGDAQFIGLGSSQGGGNILIICPYREACNRYNIAITFLPAEVRWRVEARTFSQVLTAEADFVFVDLVRKVPNSFLDDSKSLCAALTRARQAEVLMMSHTLTRDHKWEEGCLKRLWKHCDDAGAVHAPNGLSTELPPRRDRDSQQSCEQDDWSPSGRGRGRGRGRGWGSSGRGRGRGRGWGGWGSSGRGRGRGRSWGSSEADHSGDVLGPSEAEPVGW